MHDVRRPDAGYREASIDCADAEQDKRGRQQGEHRQKQIERGSGYITACRIVSQSNPVLKPQIGADQGRFRKHMEDDD